MLRLAPVGIMAQPMANGNARIIMVTRRPHRSTAAPANGLADRAPSCNQKSKIVANLNADFVRIEAKIQCQFTHHRHGPDPGLLTMGHIPQIPRALNGWNRR